MVFGGGFPRITQTTQRNSSLDSIRRRQFEVTRLADQLSSGFRIRNPSDDPVGLNRALRFQQAIGASEQFSSNIQVGTSHLRQTSGSLDQIQNMILRARAIQVEMASDTSTLEMRAVAAVEIDQILSEVVALANTRIGGQYLFGGTETLDSPFVQTAGGVLYQGNNQEIALEISESLKIAINVHGERAFGALSDEIKGDTDLDPDLELDTQLSLLNGGSGMDQGSIRITTTVPASSFLIDLRGTETIGDVTARIADVTGGAVFAAITGTGEALSLTAAAGTISVVEVDGGTTAADLGILAVTPVASPFSGTDLNPDISLQTKLPLTVSGADFDRTGFTITNGTNSATISFAGLSTIEDVINRINAADVYVHARINADGTGIDVLSKLSGVRLSITEGGGTTAASLGLLVTLDEVRLDDLNLGRGVTPVNGADFSIEQLDGTTIDIDISGAKTVGDVVSLINSDTENVAPGITASVAGSTIVLTDASVGAGPLKVSAKNGSSVATELGLSTGTVVAGVLTGSTLTSAGVQADNIFSALINFRTALLSNDQGAIASAGDDLDRGKDTVLVATAEVGAREARFLLTENRHMDERVTLTQFLSEVRDVDLADTAVNFQREQQALVAALRATATIFQSTLLNFI